MFCKRWYVALHSRLRQQLAQPLLVVGALLSAAAGLQAQAPVDTVVIEAPLGEAWTALVAVYEELDLPTALHDQSASQLGTGSYRVRRNRIGRTRLSQYLDCGQGLEGEYANVYDVTLELLTTLRRVEPNRTALLVSVQASARQRTAGGDAIHCTPNRRLAQRLGELMTEQLSKGG